MGRAVAVVLGVVAAIAAITLVAIGIAALVRGHHHTPTTPVVTVTTDR